jgi:NADH-quinone oxidoreductase subunit M
MIGLPMLNGFIGEFLVLSSTFTGVSQSWAAAATLGVILSAAYMLTLVQKVFYGPQSTLVASHAALDLNGREQLNLWPLAILMLLMGILPNIWLSGIETQARESVGWSSLKAFVAPDCVHHKCYITLRVSNLPAGGQK